MEIKHFGFPISEEITSSLSSLENLKERMIIGYNCTQCHEEKDYLGLITKDNSKAVVQYSIISGEEWRNDSQGRSCRDKYSNMEISRVWIFNGGLSPCVGFHTPPETCDYHNKWKGWIEIFSIGLDGYPIEKIFALLPESEYYIHTIRALVMAWQTKKWKEQNARRNIETDALKKVFIQKMSQDETITYFKIKLHHDLFTGEYLKEGKEVFDDVKNGYEKIFLTSFERDEKVSIEFLELLQEFPTATEWKADFGGGSVKITVSKFIESAIDSRVVLHGRFGKEEKNVSDLMEDFFKRSSVDKRYNRFLTLVVNPDREGDHEAFVFFENGIPMIFIRGRASRI